MLPAPWGLGALPAPMSGCKQQCVLGFPAPGYFAAALVAAGGGAAQQLASTHGFVSEGQPVCQAACVGAARSSEAAAPAAVDPPQPPPAMKPAPATTAAAAEGLVLKPSPKLASATGSTVPAWIEGMLASTFFGPCEAHRALKKNECTFFCASPSCGAAPRSLCQHCVSEHAGHQVIQIRRYVYCDVIRAVDISQYMDTAGVQCYIINQAKVMFLNPRPQSKVGGVGAGDTCRTCARHLREGSVYCCLACKVGALQAGDAWLPSASSCHTLTGEAAPCSVELSGRVAARRVAAAECGGGGTGSSSSSGLCGGGATGAAAVAGGKRGAAGGGGGVPLAAATVALLQALHTSSDEEEEQQQLHREVSPPAAKRHRGMPALGPSTPGARVPARMPRQGSSDCEADISVAAAAALCGGGGGAALRPPAAPPPPPRVLLSCGSGGLSSRRKQNSPRKSAV